MSGLSDAIRTYYDVRGLVWPEDADTALQFALTEIAEATELLLERKAQWVRNSPEDKEPFDIDRLEEELGDVLMMVQVAGMVEGCDPMLGMIRKMGVKLAEEMSE